MAFDPSTERRIRLQLQAARTQDPPEGVAARDDEVGGGWLRFFFYGLHGEGRERERGCPREQRQAKIYQRFGIDLSPKTIVGWVEAGAWMLSPVAQAIHERVLKSHVSQADDTHLLVLQRGDEKKKGGKGIRRGRIWIWEVLGPVGTEARGVGVTPDRSVYVAGAVRAAKGPDVASQWWAPVTCRISSIRRRTSAGSCSSTRAGATMRIAEILGCATASKQSQVGTVVTACLLAGHGLPCRLLLPCRSLS